MARSNRRRVWQTRTVSSSMPPPRWPRTRLDGRAPRRARPRPSPDGMPAERARFRGSRSYCAAGVGRGSARRRSSDRVDPAQLAKAASRAAQWSQVALEGPRVRRLRELRRRDDHDADRRREDAAADGRQRRRQAHGNGRLRVEAREGRGPTALSWACRPRSSASRRTAACGTGCTARSRTRWGSSPASRCRCGRRSSPAARPARWRRRSANPTDLMKVRLQTDGMTKDAPTATSCRRSYTGMVDAFMSIDQGGRRRARGLLWTRRRRRRSAARPALAAAELATYDEVKETFKARTSMKDGDPPRATCTAFISGYVSTVASSPFDVVSSRVMGQPKNRRLARDVLLDGRLLHQVVAVGARRHVALQWPGRCFARVVPRVTVVFLVMEQLEKNFG